VSNIAEFLEIDPGQVEHVPALLIEESFFNKLAEYGIVAADESEAYKLLQLSDALCDREAKIASANTGGRSILDYGLDLLNATAKTASASDAGRSEQVRIAAEASEKTAAYLNSPELFAAGLIMVEQMHGGKNAK